MFSLRNEGGLGELQNSHVFEWEEGEGEQSMVKFPYARVKHKRMEICGSIIILKKSTEGKKGGLGRKKSREEGKKG